MIRVGQKLQEERLRQGLTIEDVSENTKIRPSFLEAIEKGEYDKLPSASYAHGFVKNYTNFLGLPEKEILALFRREFDEEKIYRVLPQGMARDFHTTRIKTSQFFLIAFLFITLIGYILFQYKDALINPGVSISSPKDNEVVNSTTVLVSGKTNPENVVYVGGFPVSVDENGNFKKTVSVFSGKNEIKIKVVNRFNKSTELSKFVEVKSAPIP